jgi:hypothetical protein
MKSISLKTSLLFGVCGGIALLAGCNGDDTDTSGFNGPAPSASTAYSFGEGLATQNHHYGYCQPIPTTPRDFEGCAPASGDARAEVASAKVLGLADVELEDTGDVHTSPGITDTLLTASAPGLLSAGVVSASASSSSSGVNAAASIAGLDLAVLGVGITADAVDTTANASCGTASGSTIITNLKIAGVHVDVTAEPNVTIAVGTLLKVVLNEQVAIANGISVRAIHVTALNGSADVIIALSNASTTASCCAATPDSGTTSDGGITIVIPNPFPDGGILPPIPDPLTDGGILPPIPDPLTDGGILPPIPGPSPDAGPPIFPHPSDGGSPPSDAGGPVPGTPCDDSQGCGPEMMCVPLNR